MTHHIIDIASQRMTVEFSEKGEINPLQQFVFFCSQVVMDEKEEVVTPNERLTHKRNFCYHTEAIKDTQVVTVP